MAKKKASQQKQSSKPRKSRKKGGLWTVLITAFLTVIIGIIILSYFGDRISRHVRKKTPPSVQEKTPQKEALKEINVFFSDEEGLHIKAEKRRVRKASLDAEVKEALEALIEGPRSGLASAIPEGTRLLGVKVKGPTAFIDFSSEIIKNHPGGSSGELQTIYSIIDTVALNFPAIKEVQILVEGKKEETLAGHIDISLPLGPDTGIIKN